MYNAGKSFLLNVLLEHVTDEDQPFATGAARVTSRVSQQAKGNAIFVDTPGIDGHEQDDETAWDGISGADYFLYAHSLSSTELETQERDFLKTLKNRVQGLRERAVLVITQIDQAPDETTALARQAEIVSAFRTAAGFKPKVFAVSATRYAKGMRNAKAVLVEKSGIPALRNWIDSEADPHGSAAWSAARGLRLEKDKAALTEQLQAIAKDLNAEWRKRSRAHKQRSTAFESAVAQLVVNVQYYLKKIDALHR